MDRGALTFKTEVRQLLDILANALYTDKAIFLRELISNASDALNRVQFELLTNREVVDPEAELAIRVEGDEEKGTITVSDTGIGMTREELIENLGTIAHSGARAFLEHLKEGASAVELIGQFGVGFYAAFMVADEVEVITRSYRPQARAWRWRSDGQETYTIEEAEKEGRGTDVILHLKEEAREFASPWRLKQIIRKHSNYIAFPIYVGDEVVNERTAPWRTSPQEMTEEAYIDFYKQLTLDDEPPLLHLHFVADAPVNIRSLLYIPRKGGISAVTRRTEFGLRLYSHHVLIQQRNRALLPEHFRFVEGVVESEDIPLNISRETVQSSRVIAQIRRALNKRLLKALRTMMEERPADYTAFWNEYAPFIKEGIITQPFDHDDLVPLLRFHSSALEGDALTSLADYVARMKPEQEAIYYILGERLESVRHSPHLDPFRARGLEVLYLTDPFDGMVMQTLREFEGKPLRNVDDPALMLPPLEEEHEEGDEAPPSDETLASLRERIKAVLGERITEVRPSQMLRGHPARLVSAEGGAARDFEQVRRLVEQDYRAAPRILEINPRHPLIRGLAARLERTPDDPLIELAIEQLYDNLLLLEGLHTNPAEMVPRLQQLLEAAVGSDA